MSLPSFVQPNAVIVIDGAESSAHNGAWQIERITDDGQGGTRLLLQSAHRENLAYLNTNFNVNTMRPLDPARDIFFKDAFLPLGSEIEIKGSDNPMREGLWKVDSIVKGDSLDNAKLCLKKIAGGFNSASTQFMTTEFNPQIMTITKKDFPKVSRYKSQ